jgi:hypothetical protein
MSCTMMCARMSPTDTPARVCRTLSACARVRLASLRTLRLSGQGTPSAHTHDESCNAITLCLPMVPLFPGSQAAAERTM